MDKNKRFKVIISVMIIVFGTLSNLYFSTFLHQALSVAQEEGGFTIPSLSASMDSIKEDKNHFKLFISIEAIVFLMAIAFCLINDKTYQSDFKKITPNIFTPVSAGQGQFGSARWLTEDERKTFSTCILNRKDDVIDFLMKHGYDDLKDLENISIAKGADGNTG